MGQSGPAQTFEAPNATEAALAAPLGLRSSLRSAALLVGATIILFTAAAFGVRDGMAELRQAAATLPLGIAASAGVHIPQVVLTALAWRCLLPPALQPTVGAFVMLRWFRESAMTLLPAGAVVGQVAAARTLTSWRVPGPLSAATATMDVTVESVSQAAFTVLGLGLLFAVSYNVATVGAAVVGSLVGVAGIAALVALQGSGVLSWGESILLRWFPTLRLDALRSFRIAMAELRHARTPLLKALLCHSTAWLLGSVEIMAVLALAGRPAPWSSALVIESLSQAMRIAGLILPGAIGVQEGAIIASAALVGIAPQSALVIALVRRARELLVSLLGFLAWAGFQRKEYRRRAAPLPQGS